MFLTDTRAQSVQIGVILLFGIAVIAISGWQASVIPDQTQEIEFNHNQEVQQQLTELRTTVTSMGERTTGQSVTVDLGVRYPSRSVFVNPPPASGEIRTVATSDEEYAFNLINTSPTDENLAHLWDETGAVYNTGAIVYEPRYNEYRDAPRSIYEHSVLFNAFEREGATLAVTGQSIVRGDRINLIALNGTLSDNRVDSTSVDIEPLSTQTREVEVEPEDGPITIELPTRMSQSEWDELLDDNHSVSALAPEEDPFSDDNEVQTLRIKLDATLAPEDREAYRLQLAKVGIGTDTTETTAQYLSEVGESNGEFTVEVRDEFNKPIQGEEVTISPPGEDNVTKTSDTDGRVSYEPIQGGMLTFSIGEADKDQVTFEVEEDDSSPGGNPVDGTVVVSDVSGGPQDYDVRFTNEAGEEKTITNLRISFYSEDADEMTVTGDEIDELTLPIPGGFEDGDITDVTLEPGEETTLNFEADPNMQGSFMIASIRTADGETETYFILFP